MSDTRTVTVPQQQTGDLVRADFGGTTIDRKAETASSALAAQASAAVQARFVMAMQRPRDMDATRVKILGACRRPLFADNAIYFKPVGKKQNRETGDWEEAFVEGLNIRFAEEAIRNLGNAMTETITIYDDPRKRIVRVAATDLETNTVHYKDIMIEKTIERRQLKKGQQAIGQRVNSYGDPVFIVEATEDDLLTKQGAAVAKAMRDKILMLIPSDIQEEARQVIKKVQADKDAKDPDAARKILIDTFADVGIMPPQLVEYVGHELTALTPAELQRLRKIYSAIKEGEATWSEIVEQRRDVDKEKAKEAGTAAAAPAAAKGKANVNDLAKDAKAKREAAAKPTEKPAEDKGDEPAPGEMPEPGSNG